MTQYDSQNRHISLCDRYSHRLISTELNTNSNWMVEYLSHREMILFWLSWIDCFRLDCGCLIGSEEKRSPRAKLEPGSTSVNITDQLNRSLVYLRAKIISALLLFSHSYPILNGYTVVSSRSSRRGNGGEFLLSRRYFALSRKTAQPDRVCFPPAWIPGEVEWHTGHPGGQ